MAYDKGKGHRFKKGNQIWKVRATNGREALFTTPMKLWEAAIEYFQWADDNPLFSYEIKVVNKGLKGTSTPLKRPYTWQEFAIFCGVNTVYFAQFKNTVAYKSDPDFANVLKKIEDIIYSQKYNGAAVGLFNSTIIARDLGLADKQEVRGSLNIDPDAPVTFE